MTAKQNTDKKRCFEGDLLAKSIRQREKTIKNPDGDPGVDALYTGLREHKKTCPICNDSKECR